MGRGLTRRRSPRGTILLMSRPARSVVTPRTRIATECQVRMENEGKTKALWLFASFICKNYGLEMMRRKGKRRRRGESPEAMPSPGLVSGTFTLLLGLKDVNWFYYSIGCVLYRKDNPSRTSLEWLNARGRDFRAKHFPNF